MAHLHFLGTAGARHVVASQARHSGGLIWSLPGHVLWVDPGPGALVRALEATPRVEPRTVDTVLLSHKHLDHTGDANAVIEAITAGGTKAKGRLLCPSDCLGEEPAVYSYARKYMAQVRPIAAGDRVELTQTLSVSFPIEHQHGCTTLGYRVDLPGLKAAHVVDSLWFDGLIDAYRGVDLLIVNTTRPQGGNPKVLHLGVDDAEKLIRAIQPRLALMTHMGMQVVPRAEEFAAELTSKTGVPVQAARDNWIVPLDPLIQPQNPNPKPS